ncbi:MAG: endo-1,4-beta-xylanase [Pedobacter sp.]|uniref:endo-1,4-beta-xylanase n=1 Tax=Pedobacter sp. TaxID=1411316 RepID=UPI002806D1F1|nr:endo-1,4-beta-xylanase [Pedobacter sp.]MDQ8006134.1 endo-1,4-beta-xylanase [Pedobacter sp.]
MFLTKYKLKFLIALAASLLFFCCVAQQSKKRGLKDFYRNYFPVGVAINKRSLVGDELNLIKHNFNSLTAENAMKMTSLQPKEGVFNWSTADSIVGFAVKNKFKVRGHTLCWHNQTPEWMFLGANGEQVSKELLLQRLKIHIQTVVKRYRGKIYAWDVVNEAIDDNPNNYLRRSKWYEVLGEDYIAKAFEFAHEADPNAQLFYNDYNIERPDKMANVLRLLKSLKQKDVPIHGVGMQSHWSIFEPDQLALETAIQQYAALDLKIHITELDISVYPWEAQERKKRPDESEAFTAEMEQKQIDKYEMIFKVFRKYKDVIENVTFWNVSDRYSWLDFFPVSGRKNYPLLFNKNLQPKKAYWKIVNFKHN